MLFSGISASRSSSLTVTDNYPFAPPSRSSGTLNSTLLQAEVLANHLRSVSQRYQKVSRPLI